MKYTRVKICGIKDVKTLTLLEQLQVDYAGFVFAKSKRQVSPEQVGHWIRPFKARDTKLSFVGVVVNPGKDDLTSLMEVAPLDVIQLHGQETPKMCQFVKERFHVNVIKVFSVSQQTTAQHLIEAIAPYVHTVDAVMLDTFDPHVGGGTGRAFRWDVIEDVKQYIGSYSLPLAIAGGLHAENVRTLIEQHAPDMIDLSSGVETNGEKDHVKIRTLMEKVRT